MSRLYVIFFSLRDLDDRFAPSEQIICSFAETMDQLYVLVVILILKKLLLS